MRSRRGEADRRERRLFRADLRDVPGEDDRDCHGAGQRGDRGDEPQRDGEHADGRPGRGSPSMNRSTRRTDSTEVFPRVRGQVPTGGTVARVHSDHDGEQPDLVRVLAVERGREEHDAARRPVAQVERPAGDADNVEVETRAVWVADIHRRVAAAVDRGELRG